MLEVQYVIYRKPGKQGVQEHSSKRGNFFFDDEAHFLDSAAGAQSPKRRWARQIPRAAMALTMCRIS